MVLSESLDGISDPSINPDLGAHCGFGDVSHVFNLHTKRNVKRSVWSFWNFYNLLKAKYKNVCLSQINVSPAISGLPKFQQINALTEWHQASHLTLQMTQIDFTSQNGNIALYKINK